MKKVWEGTVEVRGEVVGNVTCFYVPSHPWRPVNRVMVCPECGDAWAKTKLTGAGSNSHYQALHSPCEEHGGGVLFTYLHNKNSKTEVKVDSDIMKRDFMILSDMVLNNKFVHQELRIQLL